MKWRVKTSYLHLSQIWQSEKIAKETEKYQSIWSRIMSSDQLASAQLSEGIAKLKMLPQEKQ